MKKILNFIMSNPITNGVSTLLVYCFYALLMGISLIPSVALIHFTYTQVPQDSFAGTLLLALSLGAAFYLYLFFALLVMGSAQRLLIIGFKEGRYPVDSPVVARWLIFSGIHIILITTVLPLVAGTPFNQMYFRLLGCKIGKNVFINTAGLHDAYLLELGDNVVIGGKADITCHIFEAGYLILSKIKIGNNVLVGSHTLLQPGVTIGQNCSIGIYTHLRKNTTIPDGSIIGAVPGMPMRSLVKLEKLIKDDRRSKQAEKQ